MHKEREMEILNYELGRIIQEYGDAGYPSFPDSKPFVDRLMAEGFTRKEAIDNLAWAWAVDNYDKEEV
jgi:hypothetical protein